MQVVTAVQCSGHGRTVQWSRAVHASGHGRMYPTSHVGSSPAAINFGVTLVGTFVFGILSEEHPVYGSVSSLSWLEHKTWLVRLFLESRVHA
ncbi:unnamed protein product [Sphenostylis stenocarpa]|uniref:Uncharacterized protein n=1 Tax=Sphenostylis stenocarpa TaxID=92480 RepID=A0AA86W4B4_9FABA|nr:unnamed protein product [Sphenostylis stenocarpa]